MAQATVEQKDAIHDLITTYGDPLQMGIEYTPSAYGIIRLEWGPDFTGIGPRQILLRPDGQLLTFRELERRRATLSYAPPVWSTLPP